MERAPQLVTLTDNATGSPQSVSLTGTGTAPAVSISPTSLTFASQVVGTASAAQSITLNNTGNAAMSITSLALTGANASDFTETNTCGSSLAASASCSVSVTFRPAASGSRTASLSITDNVSGSPQAVTLSGTGTSAAAVVSLSSTSLAFGNESGGHDQFGSGVTLNNTGNAALSITSIAFTGANATDFTQVDTCGASVAAGGNCTIAILFTPSATGTRVASLSITDNASGSPQPVSLSGTGTQPAPTGPTYYVDNCVVIGSDANNGTSTATPWLTINKVNASTFNPGDSILFESTCTWREQLTVPSSGSAASPITFGAYGTGAQPIISGADLLTSWVSETPLYYASALVQPNQVFRDGQRLTLAASKAALATGQWWWDSTNSRVYVYDNPSGHTIEAGQHGNIVMLNGMSYVTINGIQADKSDGWNGDFFISNGSSHITLNGIVASDSSNQGVWIDSSADGDILVENCSLYNDGGAFITAEGYAASAGHEAYLQNCSIHNNEYDAVALSGSYAIVQYNNIYNNAYPNYPVDRTRLPYIFMKTCNPFRLPAPKTTSFATT